MLDLLSQDFMVRALVAAAFTGLAAPAVGTFLVQRRLSLMGDGIGHISVTGVALGLLTGASPTLTAIAVAVVGAVAIELIRASGRASGDVALALIFYGGLAGGLMLVSIGGDGIATLQSYLFGSILSISSPTRPARTISIPMARCCSWGPCSRPRTIGSSRVKALRTSSAISSPSSRRSWAA